VWINLEYLSAESWVDEHHALPSPHPRLPLTKYFFFPGFTRATGGVLIEDGLSVARDAFAADAAALDAFRRSLGMDTSTHAGAWISLFCYENAALPGLVTAWAAEPRGVTCVVPEGRASAQLAQITGRDMAAGTHMDIGRLRLNVVPFLAPEQYDRLLWSCDLNFVRGEDSFVRAQLAARPLIWQAYPQDEAAHLVKVGAFWGRYTSGFEGDARPYARLFNGWNRLQQDCGHAWPDFLARYPEYLSHARTWARHLAGNGGLALNLAKFCEDRLE
jgi:uncharacterized repeat protein (TIGR03837 family)